MGVVMVKEIIFRNLHFLVVLQVQMVQSQLTQSLSPGLLHSNPPQRVWDEATQAIKWNNTVCVMLRDMHAHCPVISMSWLSLGLYLNMEAIGSYRTHAVTKLGFLREGSYRTIMQQTSWKCAYTCTFRVYDPLPGICLCAKELHLHESGFCCFCMAI